MKKQWRTLIAILLVLIVVIFSWLNVQPVTISFGLGNITLPLVVVLVGSVFLGALIALFSSWTVIYRLKAENKQLSERLKANQTMRRSTKDESKIVAKK